MFSIGIGPFNFEKKKTILFGKCTLFQKYFVNVGCFCFRTWILSVFVVLFYILEPFKTNAKLFSGIALETLAAVVSLASNEIDQSLVGWNILYFRLLLDMIIYISLALPLIFFSRMLIVSLVLFLSSFSFFFFWGRG